MAVDAPCTPNSCSPPATETRKISGSLDSSVILRQATSVGQSEAGRGVELGARGSGADVAGGVGEKVGVNVAWGVGDGLAVGVQVRVEVGVQVRVAVGVHVPVAEGVARGGMA